MIVSGIKTRKSMGIGEFLDLKIMADWSLLNPKSHPPAST
jgi:hypothetical protein